MNRSDAARMARSLMNEHGLTNWVFQFDGAKRRFGMCSYGRNLISLSEHLVALNDEATVRDTVLHEIAHALAGPREGHGAAWKAICRQIGAKPERCYDSAEVTKPPARYVGICPNCAKQSFRHRRVTAATACGACCRRYNGNKFAARFVLSWTLNPARAA